MKTRQLNLGKAMALALLAAGALIANPLKAGVLENLERERAIIIDTLLDSELSAKQRQTRIATATPRLVDLERMVLRDDKLTGRNTPVVRRAFENYDLTFLASAAAEFNVAIIDNWLAQLGLTTQSLMATEVGRR
jgi:hypothetical protein